MKLLDGIITPDEMKRTRWSGGTTDEIFIYPETEEYKNKDFTYRISTASIDVDESEFTELKDYDRLIMPLTNKVTLIKGDVEQVLEPFEILRFSGDEKILSKGKTRDLNLMMRKGSRGRMEVVTEITSLRLDTREPQLLITIKVDEEGKFIDFNEIRFKNKGNELSFNAIRPLTAVIISLPDLKI